MAIEVEKKFKLTPEAEAVVRDGAEVRHRKQAEDTLVIEEAGQTV